MAQRKQTLDVSIALTVLAGAAAAVTSLVVWNGYRDRQRTRSDFTAGNEIYIPSRYTLTLYV